MSSLNILKNNLRKLANPEKKDAYQWFFKTGPGEYGEGDIFLGVTVPKIRKLAKENKALNLEKIEKLIASKIHEERLLALLILIERYQLGNNKDEKEIFNFYLKNTRYINNWDLVDLSAGKIVGDYLLNRSRAPLYRLVKSKSLWEKRISIIATSRFIREGDFLDTIKISELLLKDSHDLIHKAVGWMLREVGKKNIEEEEKFLQKHYKKMPRTMLRYAIERFPNKKRIAYLKGLI